MGAVLGAGGIGEDGCHLCRAHAQVPLLATGGKQAINDRLLVLRGRKELVFPDIDGYDEWQRKLAEYTTGSVALSVAKGLLDITISPLLQQNATVEDREAHIDIAD